MMARPGAVETTPEQLLGHLNPTERLNAPPRLFIAGDVGLVSGGFRVAIIGSRRASTDGLRRAARLARALASRNVVVVSGLAEGIDTAAHRATIEAGWRTIAVIGTGLDISFPRENRELQDTLMREHLVISQFPPGTPPLSKNFPQRNRTMALLSDASVIIEAGETSGTLHQGWEAVRLGRPLFIAQSLASRTDLTWPAKMIGYGARPLDEPELVLEVLEAERPSGGMDQVAL